MGTDHVELKHLESRRDQSMRQLKALQDEAAALSKKVQTTQMELSKIDHSIRQLKNREVDVIPSEHSILRFLERIVGVDVEAVKKAMVPDDVRSRIRIQRNCTFPVVLKDPVQFLRKDFVPDGNYRLKVKDGVVVTVLSPGE